jgi:sugar/nucleoside kinase (ribokinase family)
MYGRAALEDYKRRGIDLSGLMVVPGGRTFYCVVHLDGSGEKYLTAVVSPIISPPLDAIDYDYVRSAKIAHMCSMDYALVEAVAKNLKGSGTAISLDYEGHADRAGFESWKPLLKSVRYLFINEEGLLNLLPDADPDDPGRALERVFALGVEKVIYTCSVRGGHLYTKNDHLSYRAYRVDGILDTTGAGDCFNAAFLCATVKGYEPGRALSYAAASSALSIRHVGARTGQPTAAEVEEFLRGNPRVF